MKVIVANGNELVSLKYRQDTRSWGQRAFWLARERDLLILPDEPDAEFIRHVGAVREIDSNRIVYRKAPPGRHGALQIDDEVLRNEPFASRIAAVSKGSTLACLYPSSGLAGFASAIKACMPGATFFANGGSEKAGSKATFRSVAASLNVSIPEGAICADVDEAVMASRSLLESGNGLFVKQAHGAGGAGNEMVSVEDDPRRAPGARHLYTLGHQNDALERYWHARWDWASTQGKYPVIVEQILENRQTVYVEFVVSDFTVELHGVGLLSYVDGRIDAEVLGTGVVDEWIQKILKDEGIKIARAYGDFGYRGYLCVDAIVSAGGRIFFTEANARVTTGTHLHAFRNSWAAGGTVDLGRHLSQQTSSVRWPKLSTRDFLERLDAAGLSYNPATKIGVLLITPPRTVRGVSRFVYAIVGPLEMSHEVRAAMDNVFNV